jgi:hypothetical protein
MEAPLAQILRSHSLTFDTKESISFTHAFPLKKDENDSTKIVTTVLFPSESSDVSINLPFSYLCSI